MNSAAMQDLEQDEFFQTLSEEEKQGQIALMQQLENEKEEQRKLMQQYGNNNMIVEEPPSGNPNQMHGQNAAGQNRQNRNSKKRKTMDLVEALKDNYEVQNINLSNEIGITQREIDFINERTAVILNQSNIEEIQTIFKQLSQKVNSLYDSEGIVKVSQEQLEMFQLSFIEAIKQSAQRNGKLIFNRVDDFLKKKFSQKIEREILRILMAIIDKCNKPGLNLVNQLEIVNQFQKYVNSNVLTNVNSNIFRCINEEIFNKYIQEALDKFIQDNEQGGGMNNSDRNEHLNGNAAAANPQQMQEQHNYTLEELQAEAYTIEQTFMDLSLDQTLKFTTNLFSVFSKRITEGLQANYDMKLHQIKQKLKYAQKYINAIEQNIKIRMINFHNSKLMIFKKRNCQHKHDILKNQHRAQQINESFLKDLMKSIYYRKAQQNLMQIIDEFEDLNQIVNNLINKELENALEQVKELNQQSLQFQIQPLLFSNIFDTMMDQLIKGFETRIIPRSFERLLNERTSLDHVKKSILEKYKNQFEQFKALPPQLQTNKFKAILETKYLTAYEQFIKDLANTSPEWYFYFIEKMSTLNTKEDYRNKFILMLHQITFEKLKEVKEYQQGIKYQVEKTKRHIIQSWTQWHENAQKEMIKGFDIQKIEQSSMFESEMINNGSEQIVIYYQEDKIIFQINYQRLITKQTITANEGKKKEIMDILDYLIMNKDTFSTTLTLFFFFYYQNHTNVPIKIQDFTCNEFRTYIYDTINSMRVFNQFFALANPIKSFNFPYEVSLYNEKAGFEQEDIYQHNDDFDNRILQSYQNHQNKKQRFYFQFYLNKSAQITYFSIFCNSGRFTIDVENFEQQSEDLSRLCFKNNYAQYIFTNSLVEEFLKNNKLEILLYHFCFFINNENTKNNTTIFPFTEELYKQFEFFLSELRSDMDVSFQQINSGAIGYNPPNMYPYNQGVNNGMMPQEYQQPQMQFNNNNNQINIDRDDQNHIEQSNFQPLYANFKEKVNFPSPSSSSSQQNIPSSANQMRNRDSEENNGSDVEQEIQQQRLDQLQIQKDMLVQDKQEIQKQENIISGLQNELEYAIKEKEEMEERLKKLKNELQQKETQLQQAEETNYQLNQQITNSEGISNDEYIKAIEDNYTKKLQEEQKKYGSLESQFNDLQVSMSDDNDKYDQLKLKNDKQKEEYIRICQEKNSLEEQINQLKAQLNAEKEAHEEMQIKYKLSQSQLQEQIEQNQQLKESFKRNRAEFQESLKEDLLKMIEPLQSSIQKCQQNQDIILNNPLISTHYKEYHIQHREQQEVEDRMYVENSNEEFVDRSELIKLLFSEIKSLQNKMRQINNQTFNIHNVLQDVQNQQRMTNEHSQENEQKLKNQIEQLQLKYNDIEQQFEEKNTELLQITNRLHSDNDLQNGLQSSKIHQQQDRESSQSQSKILQQQSKQQQEEQQQEQQSNVQIKQEDEDEEEETKQQTNENEMQDYDRENSMNEQQSYHVNGESSNKTKTASMVHNNNNNSVYQNNNGNEMNGFRNQERSMFDDYNSTVLQNEVKENISKNELMLEENIKEAKKLQEIAKTIPQQKQEIEKRSESQEAQLQQLQDLIQTKIEEEEVENCEEESKANFDSEQQNQNTSQMYEEYPNQHNIGSEKQTENIFTSADQFEPFSKLINSSKIYSDVNNKEMEQNDMVAEQIEQDVCKSETATIIDSQSMTNSNGANHAIHYMQNENGEQSDLNSEHQNGHQYNHDYSSLINHTDEQQIPFSRTVKRQTSYLDNTQLKSDNKDFKFALFYQIYQNSEAMTKLIEYIKQQLNILILTNSNLNENNLYNMKQLNREFYINDNNNQAFFKIGSGILYGHHVFCNSTISDTYQETQIGKAIIKTFGSWKKEITNSKQNVFPLYFFEQLIHNKKVNLFDFIINNCYQTDNLKDISINMLDSKQLNWNYINNLITGFQNSQSQKLLVIISQTSHYIQFRYYNKDSLGSINKLFSGFIQLDWYQISYYVNWINTESQIHPVLKFDQPTLLNVKGELDQERAKLFLITYVTQILIQEQENNDTKQLVSTIENVYNYITFAQKNDFL